MAKRPSKTWQERRDNAVKAAAIATIKDPAADEDALCAAQAELRRAPSPNTREIATKIEAMSADDLHALLEYTRAGAALYALTGLSNPEIHCGLAFNACRRDPALRAMLVEDLLALDEDPEPHA